MLLNPLEGGVSYSKERRKNENSKIVTRADAGTVLFIQPKKGLHVRAIENCQILRVQIDADSSVSIIAKGSVDAGYGNIRECHVLKGDIIKKGDIIGELFPKGSRVDNSLTLSLFKDGKPIVPNW